MNKRQLKPYIPPRMLKFQGRTLQAIYAFFIDDMTVLEAANQAGITRITANTAISKVKRALMCDGWRVVSVWKEPTRGQK